MPPRDHSEKTKTAIIQVAGRLSDERGWNNVKIEDIVAEVGVTRGAFYHYFKSREDLIYSVFIQKLADDDPFQLAEQQKELNALERLRFALKHSLKLQLELAFQNDMLKIMYEPVVYKSNVFSSLEIMGNAIENLLVEGNKDGSTSVEYPKHMAHALLVICNEWINPAIFRLSKQEFDERLSFIDLLGKRLGVPILDNELRDMLTRLYEICRVA